MKRGPQTVPPPPPPSRPRFSPCGAGASPGGAWECGGGACGDGGPCVAMIGACGSGTCGQCCGTPAGCGAFDGGAGGCGSTFPAFGCGTGPYGGCAPCGASMPSGGCGACGASMPSGGCGGCGSPCGACNFGLGDCGGGKAGMWDGQGPLDGRGPQEGKGTDAWVGKGPAPCGACGSANGGDVGSGLKDLAAGKGSFPDASSGTMGGDDGSGLRDLSAAKGGWSGAVGACGANMCGGCGVGGCGMACGMACGGAIAVGTSMGCSGGGVAPCGVVDVVGATMPSPAPLSALLVVAPEAALAAGHAPGSESPLTAPIAVGGNSLPVAGVPTGWPTLGGGPTLAPPMAVVGNSPTASATAASGWPAGADEAWAAGGSDELWNWLVSNFGYAGAGEMSEKGKGNLKGKAKGCCKGGACASTAGGCGTGQLGQMAIKVLLSQRESSAVLGFRGATSREIGTLTNTKLHLSGRVEYYPGTRLQELAIRGPALDPVRKSLLQAFAKIVEDTGNITGGDPDVDAVTNRVRLVVPCAAAKMLIGPNGANLKELRASTGLKVQISEVAIGVGDLAEQMVTIQGSWAAMRLGVMTIVSMLNEFIDMPWFVQWGSSSNAGAGEAVATRVVDDVGVGSTSEFNSWDEPGGCAGIAHAIEPSVGLDALSAAFAALPRSVASRSHCIRLSCPTACVSSVLGENGACTSEIMALTGARVSVRESEDGNEGEKPVTIVGSAVGVAAAYLYVVGLIGSAQERLAALAGALVSAPPVVAYPCPAVPGLALSGPEADRLLAELVTAGAAGATAS